jgi:alpha-L-rhamnosidase
MGRISFIKRDILGMRILLVLFLLINLSLISKAQDIDDNPTAQGIWFSPADELMAYDWDAQWIWLEDTIDSDVMLARRSFELAELPEQAQLRITASTQYQLYVNGTYVRRGPARSAPHHQSFDILDISTLLRTGQNTLAVRVHHQKGKFSYHHHGRAGLLAQLDLVVGKNPYSIVSDRNWKVSPDPAWDNAASQISRFQLVVNDLVDLRRQIRAWETITFDDTKWSPATPLMRKVGWPSPQKNAEAQALTPPWTALVARDVPYLDEIEEPATNLIEAAPMNVDPLPLSGTIDAPVVRTLADYQRGEGPLVIPATKTPEPYLLLFDFGKVLNGMPQLDIEGPAGTKVDILCAPFIVDNQFTPGVVDSEFRDQLTLSGARDQWEATYFKPTRYLGVLIRGRAQAVKLHRAGIRHFNYPFELQGKIHSTDAQWVAKYMEAAAKTIKVCTTDAFTDNYRERRQYAQTGYYAALGNYWTFGDHALQRRYLVQVAQEQEANGIMPAYAPLAKDDYMIIMDSNCLWIRSLRNYFLHSGDRKTVREVLPAARKLMDLLHSYTNELGFLYNPPYAYWLDHALNDRRGANLNLNGHYLGALEDFVEVLEWSDDTR